MVRTPPDERTVKALRTRVGAGCRVRRRAMIAADRGRGRAPIAQCRFTADAMTELVEPRFVDLAEVAG